jgi:RNase P subunit RPR2
MTDQDPNITLDIEHKSVRGRACPACGGKIIPSNTAVFQTQGNPEATYVSWQCERCGRQEVFERSQPAATKHAKPASALSARTTESAGNGAVGRKSETAASKRGDLPPDVRKLLEIMNSEKLNGTESSGKAD